MLISLLILLLLIVIIIIATIVKQNNKIYFTEYLDNNSINSFDIFDTLLARTTKNPTDIFEIIEKKYNIKNFKNNRILSEQESNGTFDNIYYHYKILTNENDNKINEIKNIELNTECKETIPIFSNINNINNNDILISDMYFNSEQIRKIFQYHNLNINNKIFVSSELNLTKFDKSLWKYIKKLHKIHTHTGDNIISDIKNSRKFVKSSKLTTIYKFTYLEEQLFNINKEFCDFFRRFRLQNIYDEDTQDFKTVDIQNKYNLPLLLFMCFQINKELINKKLNKILFLSRDSCLIYKLFKTLYPNYNSIYFYSSRHINKNYNKDYINYVKNNYEHSTTLIFDLHGNFESGRKLYQEIFKVLPNYFIFSLENYKFKYDNMTYIVKNDKSDILESFNIDKSGSLINFKDNKPINLPSEYNLNTVEIIHKNLTNFIKYCINNDAINKLDSILNNKEFWIYYYNSFKFKVSFTKIDIEHSKLSLTNLANKYNSDKGNAYKCKHHYTRIYEEIISDIIKQFNYKKLTLLEIGLNRDDNISIPSLNMWNEYFRYNINLFGFDINNKFLKHNKNNIKILIGDQSNENDLKQLKQYNYDIIIDDGFHASKHQQISFKELWNSIMTGGIYIIEDLHFQPEPEDRTIIKTKELFLQWKNNNWISSKYINNIDFINKIKNEIEYINFYDSKSKLHGDNVKNALVIIKKKILII